MPAPLPDPRRRRPAPGRLLAVVALAVMLIAAAIPAVSAETLYDETLESYEFTGGQSSFSSVNFYSQNIFPLDRLVFREIQKCNDISYIVVESPHKKGNPDWCPLTPGNHEMTYTLGSYTGTGTINVYKSKNAFGQITNTRITLYFDDWNIGTLTGQQTVYFTPSLGNAEIHSSITQGESGDSPVIISNRLNEFPYKITVSCGNHFVNELRIDKFDDGNSIRLIVNRQYGAKSFASNVIVYDGESNLIYNDASAVNLEQVFLSQSVGSVVLQGGGHTWNYPLVSSSPSTSSPVTVYVRNSQTGALLANARLSILASAGGTETEIINTTLPGGTATYTLQPTGGGIPNSDYYRAVASVPGYTQIVENHSFTLSGPHDVIIEMRPDTGGPTDPERCYLEFYVRDLNANPIPSASVQCGGRILQTNSAGYAIFEVAKNASHPWIAKKSGYVTIEGTATVADGPRYVVNVVLGPGTVPTHTPGETPGGPGATPTPDRRTNEQKGQAVIDMIADFAEPIALLAIVATVFGLMQMMMPRRR